jgi:hypothetical protein
MAMKYVVTDDFVAAHGWTPDKTAMALIEPLASIGVSVERVRGLDPEVSSPLGCRRMHLGRRRLM